MQPLVSIVIPIYNTARYLPQCLDSLLSQTEQAWEAILVDDGSSDDSADVAQSYAARDSRFSLLRLRHKGVAEARNRGIAAAKAEFMCYVDSDDWVEPTLLHTLLEAQRQSNADIVACGFYREYTDHSEPYAERVRPGTYSHDDIMPLLVDNTVNSSLCNKLFRRTLCTTPLPPEMVYEDHAVIAAWFHRCSSVTFLSQPLYHYRQREASITHPDNKTIDSFYQCFLADDFRLRALSDTPWAMDARCNLFRCAKTMLRSINTSRATFARRKHYNTLIGQRLKAEREALPQALNAKNRQRIRLLWASPALYTFVMSLSRPFRKTQSWKKESLFSPS